MPSTITLRDIADWARANAELVPMLGTSGWAEEPALSIANQVIAELLASENFPWKWNRALIPTFQTVQWQQDYSTNITDLGWLEKAIRTETNNTEPVKPIFELQAVRDLPPSSRKGWPERICWIPNALALCGTWAAATAFTVGQQIRDGNGNIQACSGAGTTGASQPAWSTSPGSTTIDGSVQWKSLNPDGVTLRIYPIPVESSQPFTINGIYQKKAAARTTLSQTWEPMPDELAFVYRQGFLAMCYRHANKEQQFAREYSLFQALVKQAAGSADIEPDAYGFVPDSSEVLVWYW